MVERIRVEGEMSAGESWQRALYGTMLSLMEKKRVSRWSTLVVPSAFFVVEWLQVASLPASLLSAESALPRPLSVLFDASVLVDETADERRHAQEQLALFGLVAFVLLGSLISLLSLALELRTGSPKPRTWLRILVSSVTYTMVTYGYIPAMLVTSRIFFCERMGDVMLCGSPGGITVRVLALLSAIVYSAGGLFVSLSAFPADPSSEELMRREHGNLEALVLSVKTIAIFATGALRLIIADQDWSARSRLLFFSVSTALMAFLTARIAPYYLECVTRARVAIYASLSAFGIATIAALPSGWDHRSFLVDDDAGGLSAREEDNELRGIYALCVVPPVLYVAYAFASPARFYSVLLAARVESMLSICRMRFDPKRISLWRLGLLLKSPSRLGQFARYLLDHEEDEAASESFFRLASESGTSGQHAMDFVSRFWGWSAAHDIHERFTCFFETALHRLPAPTVIALTAAEGSDLAQLLVFWRRRARERGAYQVAATPQVPSGGAGSFIRAIVAEVLGGEVVTRLCLPWVVSELKVFARRVKMPAKHLLTLLRVILKLGDVVCDEIESPTDENTTTYAASQGTGGSGGRSSAYEHLIETPMAEIDRVPLTAENVASALFALLLGLAKARDADLPSRQDGYRSKGADGDPSRLSLYARPIALFLSRIDMADSFSLVVLRRLVANRNFDSLPVTLTYHYGDSETSEGSGAWSLEQMAAWINLDTHAVLLRLHVHAVPLDGDSTMWGSRSRRGSSEKRNRATSSSDAHSYGADDRVPGSAAVPPGLAGVSLSQTHPVRRRRPRVPHGKRDAPDHHPSDSPSSKLRFVSSGRGSIRSPLIPRGRAGSHASGAALDVIFERDDDSSNANVSAEGDKGDARVGAGAGAGIGGTAGAGPGGAVTPRDDIVVPRRMTLLDDDIPGLAEAVSLHGSPQPRRRSKRGGSVHHHDALVLKAAGSLPKLSDIANGANGSGGSANVGDASGSSSNMVNNNRGLDNDAASKAAQRTPTINSAAGSGGSIDNDVRSDGQGNGAVSGARARSPGLAAVRKNSFISSAHRGVDLSPLLRVEDQATESDNGAAGAGGSGGEVYRGNQAPAVQLVAVEPPPQPLRVARLAPPDTVEPQSSSSVARVSDLPRQGNDIVSVDVFFYPREGRRYSATRVHGVPCLATALPNLVEFRDDASSDEATHKSGEDRESPVRASPPPPSTPMECVLSAAYKARRDKGKGDGNGDGNGNGDGAVGGRDPSTGGEKDTSSTSGLSIFSGEGNRDGYHRECVSEAVRRSKAQIAGLGPIAEALIDAACVIGRSGSADLLRSVAEETLGAERTVFHPEHLGEALAALERERFLFTFAGAGPGSEWFAFESVLLARELYACMDSARRSGLHHSVTAAIAKATKGRSRSGIALSSKSPRDRANSGSTPASGAGAAGNGNDALSPAMFVRHLKFTAMERFDPGVVIELAKELHHQHHYHDCLDVIAEIEPPLMRAEERASKAVGGGTYGADVEGSGAVSDVSSHVSIGGPTAFAHSQSWGECQDHLVALLTLRAECLLALGDYIAASKALVSAADHAVTPATQASVFCLRSRVACARGEGDRAVLYAQCAIGVLTEVVDDGISGGVGGCGGSGARSGGWHANGVEVSSSSSSSAATPSSSSKAPSSSSSSVSSRPELYALALLRLAQARTVTGPTSRALDDYARAARACRAAGHTALARSYLAQCLIGLGMTHLLTSRGGVTRASKASGAKGSLDAPQVRLSDHPALPLLSLATDVAPWTLHPEATSTVVRLRAVTEAMCGSVGRAWDSLASEARATERIGLVRERVALGLAMLDLALLAGDARAVEWADGELIAAIGASHRPSTPGGARTARATSARSGPSAFSKVRSSNGQGLPGTRFSSLYRTLRGLDTGPLTGHPDIDAEILLRRARARLVLRIGRSDAREMRAAGSDGSSVDTGNGVVRVAGSDARTVRSDAVPESLVSRDEGGRRSTGRPADAATDSATSDTERDPDAPATTAGASLFMSRTSVPSLSAFPEVADCLSAAQRVLGFVALSQRLLVSLVRQARVLAVQVAAVEGGGGGASGGSKQKQHQRQQEQQQELQRQRQRQRQQEQGNQHGLGGGRSRSASYAAPSPRLEQYMDDLEQGPAAVPGSAEATPRLVSHEGRSSLSAARRALLAVNLILRHHLSAVLEDLRGSRGIVRGRGIAVFTGADLASWLVRNHYSRTQSEAVLLCGALLDTRAIVPTLARQTKFRRRLANLAGKFPFSLLARSSASDAVREFNLGLDYVMEEDEGTDAFTQDGILNMRQELPPGPGRPAIEIAAELRKRVRKLFTTHVSEDGKSVRYDEMSRSKDLIAYEETTWELQQCNVADLSGDEALAFWLNLYNAMVLHAHVVFGTPTSLLSRIRFYNRSKYCVGGHILSLMDIENGVLRGNRRGPSALFRPFGTNDPRLAFALPACEPRIHFALNCGAKSCPALLTYAPGTVQVALDRQTTTFLTAETKARRSASGSIDIFLTKLIQYYYADFGTSDREVLTYVASRIDDRVTKQLLEEAVRAGSFTIHYSSYDWGTNDTVPNMKK